MNEIIDLKSKLTSNSNDKNFENRNFEIHNISEGQLGANSLLSSKSHNGFRSGIEHKEKSLPGEISETNSPSSTIEVDFAMFSELVSSPSSKKVVRENPHAKIIINANLLTQLAASHDEKNYNKLQIIFLIGLILGIAFTWVLINEF